MADLTTAELADALDEGTHSKDCDCIFCLAAARLRELDRDRGRLDWLERNQRAVMPWADGWNTSTEHPGIMRDETHKSLRESLDAAIAAIAGGRGES